MNKKRRIISVLIATFIVVMIPIISKNLSAAIDIYGPLSAYNVVVKSDYKTENSTVEGRVAVGGSAEIGGDTTKLASAFNGEDTLGMTLDDTTYPSLVVQNSINLARSIDIENGNVVAKDINIQEFLNLKGSNSSFIQDTPENLKEGIDYFSTRIDDLTEVLSSRSIDENDPALSQDYPAYFDSADKSLLLVDLAGKDIEQADTRYEEQSEASSEVRSEESSDMSEVVTKEQGTTGVNNETVINKITLEPIEDNEKLVIRSNSKYITFENTKVYYHGEEVSFAELSENESMKLMATNIIWVFPNATTVKVDDSEVIGTILAPNADVVQVGGTLVGGLFANSLDQSANATIANIASFATTYDFGRKSDTSTITVSYQDENGEAITDDNVYTREVGTTLVTEPEPVEGYFVADSSSKVVEQLATGVTATAKNQSFVIKYDAVLNSTLTVTHKLSDGTSIASDVVSNPGAGVAYTTSAVTVEGYTLLTTPTNATGTMPSDGSNVTVNYIYAPDTSLKTITIKYVDSTGADLITPKTISAQYGTAYDVSNYKLTNNGYTYNGLYSDSAAIRGTIKSDITVMFQYTANTTCSLGTSGSTADTAYPMTGKTQATNIETQFNELKSTGIVEQKGQTSTDSGYDFGTEYTSSSTNYSFMDYRYSLNGNASYDNFIPFRQTGTFESINFIISNDGNGYDLRSRASSPATIGTYVTNGVNYQKLIAASGYKSLNVQLNQCDVAVTYNKASTSSNAPTSIGTYAYTDLPAIDERVAGIAFDWDYGTYKRNMTISIIFEKEGELYYSGNQFTFSLFSTDSSFRPNDYAVTYKNTSNTTTKLYRPYSSSNRYLYEVMAFQSPYDDTTSSKIGRSNIVSNNKVYEIYALNGVVQSANQLTSSTATLTSPLPYNPKSYATIPSGSNTSSSQALYGYIAGDNKQVISGLTLSGETQVRYAKRDHFTYNLSSSASTVSFYQNQYTTLNEGPTISYNTILSLNGDSVVTNGEEYDNIQNLVFDETEVKFTSSGNYTAYGYSKTRNSDTGEFVTGYSKIPVSIAAVTMDYGDAPETYGPAGALVGSSSTRYTLGINRNSSRTNHADPEAFPLYSSDARGDDTTGMTDETGWFNMDTNGIGELNVDLSTAEISFPYTASNNATVAFWIDYNQNGTFESYEGSTQIVSASSMSQYGMVTFDIDIDPTYSTIESGDTVFARARILNGTGKLTKLSAATTYTSNYGETEDFRVHFYGKKNKYQICTQVLADSPTVKIKSVKTTSQIYNGTRESGIVYTFDVGSTETAGTYGYYPNVTATITSSQGISSNTGVGEPAFFYVTNSQSPNERPANTIHIKIRDENGNPLNLPLTFSFWDLDDFTSSTVVESVSLDKSSIYTEGLSYDMVKRTADSVGQVDDLSTYLKLYTTKQVDSEPEAMFLVQGDSLAKSDIEIVEEARLLEIGFGFDLSQKDQILQDCVEPYEPNAQIDIMGQFYEDAVPIYNSYPFKYQSTNIPFPYFTNLNSITQNLYIPDGVEFVDTDGDGMPNTDVTVYRRDLLGNRTEDDWEVVDPSSYTQTLDLANNTSSVTFSNPIGNNDYGYEYRMEYNFQISEDMATGQQVVFKSDFEYNKGKASENTEVYEMNDVTATVKQDFKADINTIMGDEVIHVETDANQNIEINPNVITYTYTYLNCDTCTNQTDKQNLTGDITIPIPDQEDMQFYSDSNFDKYEDIVLTLYDNDMKVFEIPIRRWYTVDLDIDIADTAEQTIISDDLNPVGQTVKIRAAYLADKYKTENPSGPVTIGYTQETITIDQDAKINDVENSLLRLDDINASISTDPTSKVPTSWQPTDKNFIIEVDDLVPIFDSTLAYVPDESQLCTGEEGEDTECIPPGYHAINIEASALDSTLETANVTKDNKDYKTILFKDKYTIDTNGNINLNSVLDSRYVIEKYSGRIYNSKLNKECKLEAEAPTDYNGLYCYGDSKQNYHISTTGVNNILAGYNDASDTDVKVNSILTNSFPLSTAVEKGDQFDYFVYLADFGLNNISVTIADKLEVTTTPLEYYGKDGTFYFKRTNPTDQEVECIKASNCSGEYQQIASGTIGSTYAIKEKIENDTSLLSNFKGINDWLKEYYY